MSRHLTDLEVEDLVWHRGSPEFLETSRAHLAGCSRCALLLALQLQLGSAPETFGELQEGAIEVDPETGSAVDRACEAALRRARQRERDRPRIRAALPGYLEGTLRWRPYLQGWDYVEALFEASFAERYRDPQKMLELSLAALGAAARLDPREYGPELVADLRLRAAAEHGNALRITEHFGEAERVFAESLPLLREGTGNCRALGWWGELRAALFCDRRQFAEACELFDQVIRMYLEEGETQLAGRVQHARGIATHYDRGAESALPYLEASLALLDPAADPQACAAARQSLLHAQVDCGRFVEAAQLLMASGLRQALQGEPLSLAKLGWVEGKMLAGLGKLDRAEAALLEAREEFRRHGQEFTAGIAALDLAAAQMRQGRWAEAAEVLTTTHATFERLQVHREARMALDFLVRIAREQLLTADALERISRFLTRLEHNPDLRLERDS